MNIISKVTINGKTQINGRYINLTERQHNRQRHLCERKAD